MLYWLFTDGYLILQSLLWQLVCLSLAMPIVTAVSLGAGIRRTSEEKQLTAWQQGLRGITYVVIFATITAIYIMLLADRAIAYGRPAESGFIRLVVGGQGIDQMRLFVFGAMLFMLWFIVGIGLHSGIKNGGWLRERIERLRTPQIRRGALGSSHFCTVREYKRFRREDEEGLVLLGAFWGENKQRLDIGTGLARRPTVAQGRVSVPYTGGQAFQFAATGWSAGRGACFSALYGRISFSICCFCPYSICFSLVSVPYTGGRAFQYVLVAFFTGLQTGFSALYGRTSCSINRRNPNQRRR